MWNIVKRVFIVIIGLMIMSFAAVLYLKSGLGANPMTVFTEGLSKTLNTSVGSASQIMMFCLIIIIFFIEKKRLGLGTILNAILIGTLIDVFMKLDFLNPQDKIMGFIILGAGVVLFGMGMAVYISAGLGEGAVDALMMLLHLRLRKNLKWVRIILDCCLVLAGFLLGGRIGIGTFLGMLLTGPIVEKTLNVIKSKRIFKEKLPIQV